MPPKSAKERAKTWRDRLKEDPVAYQQYLQNERERYKRQKETGSRKLVRNMTPREHRKQTKLWRKQQRDSRKRMKDTHQACQNMTPPSTSDSEPSNPQNVSHQKMTGRKNVHQDRTRAYCLINKMQVKLASMQRNIKRLQKQNVRSKRRIFDLEHQIDSPRAKANVLVREGTNAVRKELTFHYCLTRELKDKYKSLRKHREKQIMAKVFANGYLNKYRYLTAAKKSFGISGKHYRANSRRPLDFLYQRRNSFSADTVTLVKRFLVRDDNSTMTPGKKDTITRGKMKKQKRLLTDSMKNLHLKFLSENQNVKMAYWIFCRQCPYWVVSPTISDRQTCKCRIHENITFKADKLHELGIISEKSPENILSQITCSVTAEQCMYGKCEICQDNRVQFSIVEHTGFVWWYEWQIGERQKKMKTGEIRKIKITEKVRREGSVMELMERFENDLTPRFSKHVYNVRHQYCEIRKMHEQLKQNEMVLHVDFSENYRCKYHDKVQSVHFGQSNMEATLHTGILYTQSETIPFSTISECKRHDASAVWAHLQPVFTHIKQSYPEIDSAFMVSDGSTSQYHNKDNFYFISTKPYEWGMKCVNWSLLEAGHGKGAADGVGGVLKRAADKLVCHGRDLPDAKALYTALVPDTTVKLFFVSSEDVENIDDDLPKDLKTIPGTMSFHQIVSTSPYEIKCRKLSCFCTSGECCKCYGPITSVVFIRDKVPLTPTVSISRSKGLLGSTSKDGTVVYPSTSETARSKLQPVHVFSPDLVGKWCVVQYDDKPYTGIIEDADEDSFQVRVMHRIGINRFSKPMMVDSIWYEYTKLVTLIPEPAPVTKRHYQILGSNYLSNGHIYLLTTVFNKTYDTDISQYQT